MRILDWLTGTKRPAAGVAAKPAAEVRAALLAINQPTLPFVVREVAPVLVEIGDDQEQAAATLGAAACNNESAWVDSVLGRVKLFE